MKRDLICKLRLTVDKLPRRLRESRLFFLFAKIIFNLPWELFTFRRDYKKGRIKDLSILYNPESDFYIERTSKDTDINSLHLDLISNYIDIHKPFNLLDVGCGTGFLLELIDKRLSGGKLEGIDFNCKENSSLSFKNEINFTAGDINDILQSFTNNSFDIVICAHVLEHLANPEEVVKEIRRVSKKLLILICPLEKPYKWGLNYHVQFFENSKNFIDFARSDDKSNKDYCFHERLGDCMYVENIELS